MRVRPWAAMGVMVFGAALVLWSPAHASTTSAVNLTNFSYQPGSLSVPAGTTISFSNNDATAHSVTADGGAFDSSPSCSPSQTAGCLQPGQSFSVTLTNAGTYAYHCRVHSFMHGTIVVTAASTTTTTSAPTSTTTSTIAPSTTAATPPTTSATKPPSTVVPSPTSTVPHPLPLRGQAAGVPGPSASGISIGGSTLAKTGLGVAWPVVLGGLLLLAGGVAAVASRPGR